MPELQVRTISAEQVWKSGDGSRKIHELVLDYGGKEVKAQTFSDKISTVGWEGTVETYEKNNNTFVRQPAKEGFAPGRPSSGSGSPTKAPYVPKDEAAIKAMWAIGQAMNMYTSLSTDGNIQLPLVEKTARDLFAMVDRVKAGVLSEASQRPKPDGDEEPANLASLFDQAEKAAEEADIDSGELPWPPPTKP